MSHFDNNDYIEEQQSMNYCIVTSHEDEPFYYQGKYLLNKFWYHENFPMEWARNHEEGTGPIDCANCAHFGSINGIFISYCCNCANYVYNFKRGRGFIDIGEEEKITNISKKCSSVFDTYLKDVDINTIEPVLEDNIHITNNYDDYDDYDDYYDSNCIVDDYDENSHFGVMDCHFEGGYNDF